MTRDSLSVHRSRPCSPVSSVTVSSSGSSLDDDTMDMLRNVREMNQKLLQQIDILRLKIQVDENNYSNEKTTLLHEQQSQVEAKVAEIEDMRVDIVRQDDKTQQLKKDSIHMEMTIRDQLAEIEHLKAMVEQITAHADKIQKQFARDQKKIHAARVYEQQVKECQQLDQETKLLRHRLSEVEQALVQVMKVIEEQDTRLKTMGQDEIYLRANFREELNKATKTVKWELVRTKEILQQTYVEMKKLRTVNTAVLNEVHAIKDMLSSKRNDSTTSDPEGHPERPPAEATNFQSPNIQHLQGQTTTAGKMAGQIMFPVTESNLNTRADRQDDRQSAPVFRSNNQSTPVFSSNNSSDVSNTKVTPSLSPEAETNPDLQERRPGADRDRVTPQNLHKPWDQNTTNKDIKVLPVCTVKIEVLHMRKPTKRGGHVRKGITFKK